MLGILMYSTDTCVLDFIEHDCSVYKTIVTMVLTCLEFDYDKDNDKFVFHWVDV
jgi:hypothetical protein